MKLALLLVAAGLLVGALVAAVSVATALPFCGSGVEGDECRALVVTLARRAGLVAGAAAVLMVLLAAGLAKSIGPEIAVPMHFGFVDGCRGEGEAEIFRREADPVKVEVLTPMIPLEF